MSESDLIQSALAEIGLAVDETLIHSLIQYVDLLEKWGSKINLLGRVSRQEIWIKHIFDSLAIHAALKGPTVLDLGAGAGLPGIPLALFTPHHWILVEPRGKRAQFLRQVINKLQLKHVEIRQERAENLQLAAGVETIVSRAVADLSTLVKWSQHLLAPAGRWVLMKGPMADKAIASGEEGLSLQLQPVVVPFLQASRQVLIAERIIDIEYRGI